MRALVLLVLFASPFASAQTAAPGRLTYVSLGLGVAGGFEGAPNTTGFLGGSTTGPSVAADLHVVRNVLHVQAGASFQAFGLGPQLVLEGHLLAGAARTVGPAVLTASAGPSLARVERAASGASMQGRVEREDRVIPGLYASVGVAAVVVPEVGFGIEAFGHLNARMPVAGLRLTAVLGRLPRSVVR